VCAPNVSPRIWWPRQIPKIGTPESAIFRTVSGA